MNTYHIKNHITAAEVMFHEIKTGIEMERHYGLNSSRLPVTVETAITMLKISALRLACKTLGHKMIDNSTAGPDTGCVDVYCQRCGYSYHQTLY